MTEAVSYEFFWFSAALEDSDPKWQENRWVGAISQIWTRLDGIDFREMSTEEKLKIVGPAVVADMKRRGAGDNEIGVRLHFYNDEVRTKTIDVFFAACASNLLNRSESEKAVKQSKRFCGDHALAQEVHERGAFIEAVMKTFPFAEAFLIEKNYKEQTRVYGINRRDAVIERSTGRVIYSPHL